MKWIIDMSIGEMCGICQGKLPTVRNCPKTCPITTAVEAMSVDVPEGFEFKGILEKCGEKSDWTKIKLYAVKRGQ